MRTLATDATADQLLDHLTSDGAGGEWTYFADRGDWQSLYNLRDDRFFVGRLARNLSGRGFAEMRRTALGWRRFEAETGIRYHDWYGQYWTRWSDAVREAGLQPNRMSQAIDDDFLLEKLVALTRRLMRVPVQGDLLLAARNDSTFPSEKVFRRLGSKPNRVSRVIAYCDSLPGHEDVASLQAMEANILTDWLGDKAGADAAKADVKVIILGTKPVV